MKTTIFATSLLAALAPIASGWQLQLYSSDLYHDEFHRRSGEVGTDCTNLEDPNLALSMKWQSGVWYGDCDIYLYDRDGCNVELARSIGGDWNNMTWHYFRFHMSTRKIDDLAAESGLDERTSSVGTRDGSDILNLLDALLRTGLSCLEKSSIEKIE
ncbi:hypothetical protein FQN52_006320 [Onygenales sp. PD_12]|nr:hypothetical protein FQN52_006320 [Onygenales sp. PD_12]